MSELQQDLLSTLFGSWREVADETTRRLGGQTANLFVYLYNDTLDILGAIHGVYSEEELPCSLVYADFTALFKELDWLHALFLFGNYPVVLSRLRFNWERIFRARYAAAYAQENPSEADVPGPTIGDKHDRLTKREDRLNWRTLIAPSLTRLFSIGTPAEVEAQFKPLWDRLNHCVHPSGELREKSAGESALHHRDAFDEAWAHETHQAAAEVVGLLLLAVLARFPAAVPSLWADPHTFKACPQLRAALESAVGDR
jgi:hypothetical protein